MPGPLHFSTSPRAGASSTQRQLFSSRARGAAPILALRVHRYGTTAGGGRSGRPVHTRPVLDLRWKQHVDQPRPGGCSRRARRPYICPSGVALPGRGRAAAVLAAGHALELTVGFVHLVEFPYLVARCGQPDQFDRRLACRTGRVGREGSRCDFTLAQRGGYPSPLPAPRCPPVAGWREARLRCRHFLAEPVERWFVYLRKTGTQPTHIGRSGGLARIRGQLVGTWTISDVISPDTPSSSARSFSSGSMTGQVMTGLPFS